MTLVGNVVKVAGKAVQLSEDLENMFDGNKTKLVRFVKKLVSEFGETTSILDVYKKVAGFSAPTKIFNGITYVAGNSWPYLVPVDSYQAQLLDVVVGDDKVKLLFGLVGADVPSGACYLYQTLDDLTAVDAIKYTKNIGGEYTVYVRHDFVKAINENKAIVNSSVSNKRKYGI